MSKILIQFPKRSWFFNQEEIRKKMGLARSFDSFESMVRLMTKLNRSNFQSEVAFERVLRKFLRRRPFNVRFRKNFPILNKYFGDFVSVQHRFVVEIDGSVHRKKSVKDRDAEKDKILCSAGWKVFRISFPSMSGFDTLCNWIDAQENFRHEDHKGFKKKRHEFLHNGIPKRFIESNSMLVGCKIDESIIKAMRDKERRLESVRQNYRKHGIKIDF